MLRRSVWKYCTYEKKALVIFFTKEFLAAMPSLKFNLAYFFLVFIALLYHIPLKVTVFFSLIIFVKHYYTVYIIIQRRGLL